MRDVVGLDGGARLWDDVWRDGRTERHEGDSSSFSTSSTHRPGQGLTVSGGDDGAMTTRAPSAGDATDHRPQVGVGWMLPFYDTLSSAAGMGRVHRCLIDGADMHRAERVLDIGCGTGAVTLLAKRAQPLASVIGLDPDEASLARAARKALDAGLDISFDLGLGGSLPYANASIDRVLSSFVVHHLPPVERDRTLAEALRVLSPGGSLHLVDFGDAADLGSTTKEAGFPRGAAFQGSVLRAVPVALVRAEA